jgi:small conductance mechanosensitive channel
MQEELDMIQKYTDIVIGYLASNAVRLVIGFVILLIGLYFAKAISRTVLKLCAKRNIDVTLSRFFASSVKVIIIVLASVVALSKIGVEITPFIALLGAGAFGFSLAVQGPISNFGAGIVIILTRPYVVGDTLRVHDVAGVVDEVNLGQTLLASEDGERISIPNRKILGEILTNSYEFRIIEGVVRISYSDNPETAIKVVTEALSGIRTLDSGKQPEIGIEAFGDSSVNIAYRVWAPTQSYHQTLYEVNLAVYKAVQEAGLTIPFPQRDVNLRQQS